MIKAGQQGKKWTGRCTTSGVNSRSAPLWRAGGQGDDREATNPWSWHGREERGMSRVVHLKQKEAGGRDPECFAGSRWRAGPLTRGGASDDLQSMTSMPTRSKSGLGKGKGSSEDIKAK